MNRISLHVRMQCILCTWAGPKILLDFHVMQRHTSQIVKQDRGSWYRTYKFGSLTEELLWLSEVREYDGSRYVLSIKKESGGLMISLSTLTIDAEPKMGTLTIYNKITGQPFTWDGPIQLLPNNMPYENDGNFMRVSVDELDIKPRNPGQNSTPTVAGRLDPNDVYFNVFVNVRSP